ncbi:GL18296 [Drosophila persimilis]|uniref:GL18296 n=1 Tax=Drosophila persimilis TaxID=7234 RepID=B4H4N7_DROPE|nr:GL18296 [Drosophila persimilis]
MVVKLLLANLWVCLSVWDWGLCQAYDFGYHPSAEEFDSLWHRELLANDRRRMEQRFVPRQEEDADQQQPYVFESVEEAPTNTQPAPDLMHVQSQLLEIKDPTPQRPFVNHHRPANGSSAQASFPIFFTNPATGIVYAISQVGEGAQGVQGSQPRNDSGGAIAIYVTKAQYDADIQALRQHYEEQCQQQQQQQQQTIPPGTVLSTPNLKPSPQQGGVTARPQIIRLQKPKKRPGWCHQQAARSHSIDRPPVMVTSGPITTIQRSGRKKRKKKKPSPVKAIKRRPGHKRRSNSTTERPAGPPPIILGTRPSSSSSTTTTTTTRPPPGSTQLEKPHMPQATTSTGNIFSQHAYVINQGYHPQHPHSHVRRRRGLEAAAGVGEGAVEAAGGSSVVEGSAAVGRGAVVRGSTVEIPLIKGAAVGGSAAERSAVKVLPIRGSPTKGSSVVRLLGGEAVGASRYQLRDLSYSLSYLKCKIVPSEMNVSEAKAKEKERRRALCPEGSNFDIFELISGGDYDDDTEEDDAYYYEDENENGDGDEKEPQAGQATSSSSPEDPKEDSSSAEEGADFGAMEESETTTLSPTSTELLEGDQFSSTKNSMAKKRIRIRRRPPASSSEEEDDNDDDSGGIGGFFRMIFYPVQVAMSRLMDLGFGGPSSFNDEDEEEVHKVNPTKPPKYPSYTLYHSAHSNEAYAQPEDDEDEGDDDDDYDGSSTLGSWFSSWFGPGRRTKKIGSTTTVVPLPAPTQEPAGWLDSWFGFGKTTTTTPTDSDEDDYDIQTTQATADDAPRMQDLKGTATDEAQVRALEEFKKGEDGVKMHWLKGPSLRGLTDVLVPPKMLVDFQGTLNYESIAHEVLIFDVGMAIAYEQSKEDYLHTTPVSLQRPSRPKPKPTGVAKPGMTWNRYHTHDEIVQYLETMRMRHPQLVELIHIGRSYEGRPLIVVKIESKQSASAANASASGYKRPKRKRKSGQANAVFVEAGAHGLAWIGPATATWMISELLRLMKTNSE